MSILNHNVQAGLLQIIFLLLIFSLPCNSQYNARDNLFPFPPDTVSRQQYRQQLFDWREEISREYVGYSYEDSGLLWTQGMYMATINQPWSKLMIYGEGGSRAEFLTDLNNNRFGGVDLIWIDDPVPLLGIDLKNQWEIYRSYLPYDGRNYKGLRNLAES